MRATSWQEDKQTELSENEENLLMFNVSRGSKITYRLKKSLLRTAKGRSALRQRKKQRAKAEIVRKSGLVSEFNKNAKMVSKSSKHGKTLKPLL